MVMSASSVGMMRASPLVSFPNRAQSSATASTSANRHGRRRGCSVLSGRDVCSKPRVPFSARTCLHASRGNTRLAVINNNNPSDFVSQDEQITVDGVSYDDEEIFVDGMSYDEGFTSSSFDHHPSSSPKVCDSKKQCDVDFIGVDELGVGIKGDARVKRRSAARDQYWREQAAELEAALAASGDDGMRVEISGSGGLLLTPVEESFEDENEVTQSIPSELSVRTPLIQSDTSATSTKTNWTWSQRFALLAQISALGLPALVNSCVEPLLSSAETACAAKIGTVYLAALAPSSSLFAFAAEMCFAMSVVVTTAAAKAAAKASAASDTLRRAKEARSVTSSNALELEQAANQSQLTLRRTATAATTASFAVGAVLAVAFATLAEPLLRIMHVPPEVAPIVRAYVATRALGLPFFAASNAAEGVYIGHEDGVTPMKAWTATGAVSLVALLAFAHPQLLNLGLQGAAAAIALGQVTTALWFMKGMRKKGWLVGSGGNAQLGSKVVPQKVTKTSVSLGSVIKDSTAVLRETNMHSEIGWMFLGAVSRMGTYAILTASASALGVIPGATHKVALEIYWLLSFLTEPIFTACNALLPRELAKGNIGGAIRLRNALVTTAVLLGCGLASAGVFLANLGVFSDDPLVAACLKALAAPLAVSLGLAATAYGVEGTIIGCGQVAYLGKTHFRDFFVVAGMLWFRSTATTTTPTLTSTWWLLAGFQGLRIAQHMFHLWRNKPFLGYGDDADRVNETTEKKIALA